jgi:hypothetical protein
VSPGTATALATTLIGFWLLAGGCGRGPADQAPTDRAVPAVGAEVRQPVELAALRAEPVQGWTGSGGQPFEVAVRAAADQPHQSRPIGRVTYDIAMRSTGIGQFPCGSCHLPGGRVVQDQRVPDAHGNIDPVHPAALGATCSNCHARTDVERLALFSGETVTLDHAYRLCGQCHFATVDAWAGGGHGKRLDGWQGRRVVMGCSECHDPHRPALERRIPYPGATLTGTAAHDE